MNLKWFNKWIAIEPAKTVPKVITTEGSIKPTFHKTLGIFRHKISEPMKYLQFQFTGKGPDGRTYRCTMFYELSIAPDGAGAIAHAERAHPGFTDIRVTSATTISADEYAFRVRTMCDSDTWGFQLIS